MRDKIHRRIVFILVGGINILQRVFVRSENLYKLLLVKHLEKARWKIGAWRAWYNMNKAYKDVPAYRKYINKHGGLPVIKSYKGLPDLTVVVETDKESYVKEFSTEERCVGGEIPKFGVVVDESSGSSGKPTSWVRGPQERAVTRQMMQLSYHAALGKESFFIINAFALGAWATGLNVSMSLSDISIIKSTGPDIDKIVTTIAMFGPKYHYIVTGYPPFLKSLADDTRLEWKKYKISAIFGGEGMSEGMRDYLLESYNEVSGSYGASDLEINMAGENKFTIKLRKLILKNKELREALVLKDTDITPMIFQYNPLAYYIETNPNGELVFTLNRPTNIAPKIRYNLHDLGNVLRYPEVVKVLKKQGLWHHFNGIRPQLDLPLLFFYGRSDMSISYYGAKVTPDSVREILYTVPGLAKDLETFRLISYEDTKHDKYMMVAIELAKNAEVTFDVADLEREIFTRLADVNRDFANAYKIANKKLLPKVSIHKFRSGPFENEGSRLKKEYVTTDYKYDTLK